MKDIFYLSLRIAMSLVYFYKKKFKFQTHMMLAKSVGMSYYLTLIDHTLLTQLIYCIPLLK
jgi:hypothetical protein